MKADMRLLLMAFKAGYLDSDYEDAFCRWLEDIGAETTLEVKEKDDEL